MSKQTINIGASPNDGTGTPLRTSFDYTNQNFTELYTALGGGVGLPGATTQVIFNDGGTNLAGDAGLVYNKTTDALTVGGLVTAGSATITGDLTVDTSTLKVDSTNNRVGIGTASPARPLDIVGSFQSSLGWVLTGTPPGLGAATRYIGGASTTDSWYYNGLTGGSHIWAFGESTAMTLDASGNLLCGAASVVGVERLNVTKTAVGSALARFVNTNTTVDTYGIAVSYSASTPNDASHYFLGCFDSTTSRAFIYANGGLANYSANNVNLSDARTKTDIKPLASYWNKIKALELVTFKYKDQTHDDDNIGLISQQVESVAPEFVSNEGFGETPADGVPLKSIYTTDLYHAAIKALQEAMTRIEVLESKLA